MSDEVETPPFGDFRDQSFPLRMILSFEAREAGTSAQRCAATRMGSSPTSAAGRNPGQTRASTTTGTISKRASSTATTATPTPSRSRATQSIPSMTRSGLRSLASRRSWRRPMGPSVRSAAPSSPTLTGKSSRCRSWSSPNKGSFCSSPLAGSPRSRYSSQDQMGPLSGTRSTQSTTGSETASAAGHSSRPRSITCGGASARCT